MTGDMEAPRQNRRSEIGDRRSQLAVRDRTSAGSSLRVRPGFTLVEILTVIIILGIAAAIIIPQLGSRDDLRCAAGARLLMADLIYAQNRSIALQRMHFVKFDIAAQRYALLNSITPTETVIQHPVSKDVYVVQFGQGSSGLRDVKLESATFNGFAVLAFDELGVPHYYDGSDVLPMTSGSVTLSSGTFSLTVTIEPFTGEINVQ
jgi:prepilin-type N-terminal cleavage/methylation domain-containing protein